jgi:hypothetical protein
MGNRITKINGVPVLNTKVEGLTYEGNELTIFNSDKSSYSVTIVSSSGSSTDNYVTGFTYNDANRLTISQTNGDFNVDINRMTGLTVNGIMSATTYYGDGSNLTGISAEDNYVIGGTFSNSTLTLNRQNGSVVITGFTSTDYFVTGGTYDVNTDILTLNRQDNNVNINITPKPAINLFNHYNLY